MCALSLDDIYKLEYDDQGLGTYRWIHPKMILGYDSANARALATQRVLDSINNAGSEAQNEFQDTPDTLITEYLAKSLRQRRECIRKGSPLPSYWNVTPLEYIDALLYLIIELGSSYACYNLGSIHYHGDDFVSPQDARPILERLRNALQTSADLETKELIRDLTLEIFHLGDAWDSDVPRFHDALTSEENEFLCSLLHAGPFLPPPSF